MDNNNMFDSEDLTGSFDTNDIEQNKAISAIAYIPILFLVPILRTCDLNSESNSLLSLCYHIRSHHCNTCLLYTSRCV